MTIKCENVFDIQNCELNEKGSYYLDTNIWYWLTYPRVTFNSEKQEIKATEYTSFISKLQIKEAELCSTLFTHSELINIVERNEFELVKKNYQNNRKLFRKDHEKRKDTVEIISNVLEQVDEFSTPNKIVQILDYIDSQSLVKGLNETLLDSTDLIVSLLTKENDIVNIISDDADFGTLEGINLYTLNPHVLDEAKKTGKLK